MKKGKGTKSKALRKTAPKTKKSVLERKLKVSKIIKKKKGYAY